MQLRRMASGCLLTVLAVVAGSVAGQQAGQQQRFGDYTVHYNLLNSSRLTPEIAERYDIERDAETALLTISVRGPNQAGQITDQPSQVQGEARDLVNFYNLEFREYQDPNAVYYLAEVPAAGRNRLQFDIEIKPENSARSFDLIFDEQVFPPLR